MIVTRFHDLEEIQCDVEFLTPAFLGGAEQNAELRSAPFKNLLRQWWRIANGNLDPKELKLKEDDLFGAVAGESVSASKLRMSIIGSAKTSQAKIDLGTMKHPEVSFNSGNIDRALYLGYGPVTLKNGTRQYLPANTHFIWNISYPNCYAHDIKKTLSYIHHFGTIGSRARKGFGSISLKLFEGEVLPELSFPVSENLASLLLKKEYPHSLGTDKKGILAWEQCCTNWNDAMKLLGTLYMETRTNLQFPNSAPVAIQKRHILGYPVTNHKVHSWGGNEARMPSQIRLLVKKTNNEKLVARILHLPHKLPKTWDNRLGSELSVWQAVHQFLDNQKKLRRMEVNS
ncbi:MAG TPA: type III-B CRISPR module RAMP protein Cmr1 [Chitinispirillaceae bacterium]|nr:type III-B CRISPR module RAMP protein Cmr1 [Chitinispirillaceae bacterium]